MKKYLRLLSICLALITLLAVTLPVEAATSNNIVITGTPSYIGLATAQNTWTINGLTGNSKIKPSTTYYSNPIGDTTAPSATVDHTECYFTTVNSSNVIVTIKVNIPDFANGDAMANSDSGSAEATKFGAYVYLDEALLSAAIVAKKANSDDFVHEQAVGANIIWGVKLSTKTDAWGSPTAMTSTMVIAATEH
jgi:hypothetical protein